MQKKDKTVVITGATNGLGRATALQLAQKGAFVVIIARNNTKANEVIKEIKKGNRNETGRVTTTRTAYEIYRRKVDKQTYLRSG